MLAFIFLSAVLLTESVSTFLNSLWVQKKRPGIDHKAGPHGAGTLFIQTTELTILIQRGSKSQRASLDSQSLSAQLMTTLRAAGGQNLAAVAGTHALAEAVFFLALTLLGLVGTEHNSFFLSSLLLNSGLDRSSW